MEYESNLYFRSGVFQNMPKCINCNFFLEIAAMKNETSKYDAELFVLKRSAMKSEIFLISLDDNKLGRPSFLSLYPRVKYVFCRIAKDEPF
jgi:hypothetical protein